MNFKTQTLQDLRSRRGDLADKQCFAGFDGFVDTIVTPVAHRAGQGEDFAPFAGLAEFGQRIVGAAGKSTNIELYPRMDKLGGNGPIMANALLAHRAHLTYVGALGRGAVHPVFAQLASRSHVVSFADPAHTIAVECPDGKIMLGLMRSLDEVTPEAITAALGGLDGYRTALAADLVALVNWTMLPHMTAIFTDLIQRVLPGTPQREDRVFFFDLADPEKRSRADLVHALELIAKFEQFGHVTLGLNLKEAQQGFAALGFGTAPETEAGLREKAEKIRAHLEITTVVVHPKESAACATRDGTWWIPGPYCEKPLLTTGAGDHFNAGFTTGQLLGLSPEGCLTLGVATSGHYVRTAQSPTLPDLESFLANWR